MILFSRNKRRATCALNNKGFPCVEKRSECQNKHRAAIKYNKKRIEKAFLIYALTPRFIVKRIIFMIFFFDVVVVVDEGLGVQHNKYCVFKILPLVIFILSCRSWAVDISITLCW